MCKNKISSHSVNFLWLSLGLFVILTIAFLLPVRANDYWWYLRLGEDIVQEGYVPTTDTFSSTRYGQPIINQAWLAAVVLWWAHAYGGMTLTVLMRGVLVAAFYILIWYACALAGSSPPMATALTLVSALAASGNWNVRPQLFTYPLFGATLLILWLWQQGKTRPLWVLPIIVLLWANLHGSFVLAFVLVGIALVPLEANKKYKELWIALFFMLTASIINPHGVRVWQYVYSLFTDTSVQLFSSEWQPPVNVGWQNNLFFAWLLAMAPLTFFSSAKLPKTQWIWFLAFGWGAMSGLRYVIWFVSLLAPMSAYLLSTIITDYFKKRPTKRINLGINLTIGAVLLLLPLALLPGLRQKWWAKSPPVLAANTPVEAASWLDEHPEVKGNLWSDISFSSYLVYALPNRPLWIDPRFQLYPLEYWERYIDIAEANIGWQEILHDEEIELLMLDPQEQPRLRAELEASAEWCRVYADARADIFASRLSGSDCQ